jgi:hypothetical protein
LQQMRSPEVKKEADTQGWTSNVTQKGSNAIVVVHKIDCESLEIDACMLVGPNGINNG